MLIIKKLRVLVFALALLWLFPVSAQEDEKLTEEADELSVAKERAPSEPESEAKLLELPESEKIESPATGTRVSAKEEPDKIIIEEAPATPSAILAEPEKPVPPPAPKKKPALEPTVDYSELKSHLATPSLQSLSLSPKKANVAPAFVSVITSKEIEASGAETLPDLLRRTLSMNIRQTTARGFDVGIRGINTLAKSRIGVFVDGVAVHSDANGVVPWGALPASLKDIERIEIVRGPQAVLYGAGALTGAINIITKSAVEGEGFSGRVSAGTLYQEEGGKALGAGTGYASYGFVSADRLIPSVRLSASFENVPELSGYGAATRPFFGPQTMRSTLAFDYAPIDDIVLKLNGAFVGGEYLVMDSTTSPNQLNIYRGAFVNLFAGHNHFLTDESRIVFRFDTNRFNDGVEDVRTGRLTTLETATIHADLLWSLEMFGGLNAVSAGVGVRNYEAKWDFFANDVIKRFELSGIVEDEVRLVEFLAINLAGRFDSISTGFNDAKVARQSVNPRIAVIGFISGEHSVRAAASTGLRTPSFTENFQSRTAGIAPNYFLAPETSASVELGYSGLPFESLKIDSALFAGKLKNIIELPRIDAYPLAYENLYSLNQLGWEVGLNYVPAQFFWGYLNYNLTINKNAETGERALEYPMHIAGVGMEARFPHRLRLNSDLYFTSSAIYPVTASYAGEAISFKRFEEHNLTEQAIWNLRLGYFVVAEAAEFFVSGRNLAGFFRSVNNSRQYPHDFAEPIGAAILLGVTVNDK
ncbi:MAG: hypothetical protein Kow0090_12920 [Myxococcota bacterium]